ncbi:uncharacterized protein HMPREF1541_04215 [Cyphellophora europaea CBS 101466]|uniref:Tetratricopeptide repeat protein 1 n=1 Tax=Cyphellophora europaea (strain CBS 101466) TaxID=1220924 RepID=W2S2T3_CYPE1|nr:uncharacterized protein HMPREF1541_04215 [Cyphellophora europaea CBS 101466]ETN42274.1 hypothetical protein HMPREF1541_04215 [Cyphellophora europaea CBS 101466]
MSFKSSGPKTRPSRVKSPSGAPPSPPHPQPATTSRTSRPRRASSASSSSSTTSFHSAHFPAAEEARMVAASHSIKTAANAQFAAADYTSAIGSYDRAAAELPSYLDYEMAVLQSNIAACHLKMEEWKEALAACERGLDGLEKEWPLPKRKGVRSEEEKTGVTDGARKHEQQEKEQDTGEGEGEGKVVELPEDADEDEVQERLRDLDLSDSKKADITRIRIKLLLRRARARSSITPASWSHLAGAVEDYSLLSTPEYMSQLPTSDQKTVRRALVELPPRVDEAKQKEVADMMGKLKDLGNGILKPFGLSTDMFKMTQDPNTGGWSMAFDQGGGKGDGGAASRGGAKSEE